MSKSSTFLVWWCEVTKTLVGMGLIIEIEAVVRYSTCPRCGQFSRSIHQNHWRIIQDLPWSTKPVLLRINHRQFKCNQCQKVFNEELDFVDQFETLAVYR
nr:transposase family protein [Scytonema hofmannii]